MVWKELEIIILLSIISNGFENKKDELEILYLKFIFFYSIRQFLYALMILFLE